jgi:signal transduction histidine kinase
MESMQAAERDEGDSTEALAALAAKVSNELNNPLAAVMSAHHYLRARLGGVQADWSDPRIPQFFDLVDRELLVMARIVEDLRAFGSPLPLRRSTFSLRDLVEDAGRDVVHPAGVRLDNLVDDALPPVHLDREACQRALAQLLRNAVESYGASPGVVTVMAAVSATEVVLEVRDDGAGIPADLVERIREPLFGTKVKGTGLGLAIADAMVRGQGGLLSCTSEPGRGSVFAIRLPRQLTVAPTTEATP